MFAVKHHVTLLPPLFYLNCTTLRERSTNSVDHGKSRSSTPKVMFKLH